MSKDSPTEKYVTLDSLNEPRIQALLRSVDITSSQQIVSRNDTQDRSQSSLAYQPDH